MMQYPSLCMLWLEVEDKEIEFMLYACAVWSLVEAHTHAQCTPLLLSLCVDVSVLVGTCVHVSNMWPPCITVSLV